MSLSEKRSRRQETVPLNRRPIGLLSEMERVLWKLHWSDTAYRSSLARFYAWEALHNEGVRVFSLNRADDNIFRSQLRDSVIPLFSTNPKMDTFAAKRAESLGGSCKSGVGTKPEFVSL
jgi:hypothetical protein